VAYRTLRSPSARAQYLLGLLSGSAMQITTEVRCTVAGHRKHYWESHVIHGLEEIDGLLRDAATNALASLKAAE
jgi:hypothetical protein